MSRRGASGSMQMAQREKRAFLTFLPMDNAATVPESEAALRVMTQDLGWLLGMDDVDFWEAVMEHPSLYTSLDAFLQFRRRPCDTQKDSQGDSATLKRLTQQYFFLMLRLIKAPEKISTAELQRRAKWLYDEHALAVHQIFDFCLLYGEWNPDLTRHIVETLFDRQPKWFDDLRETMPVLLDNLFILQERCHDALAKIRRGDETGLVGWTDVLHYYLDICSNFTLLLEVFPAAGHPFLQNGGLLLVRLAHLHDTLLPQFDGAIRNLDLTKQDMDELLRQVHMVMLSFEKTAFLLLKTSFFRDPLRNTTYLQEEVLLERGQEFMNIIMAIADLEEDATHSLLRRVSKRFQLGNRIIETIEQGHLLLDDAQFDYLSMLIQNNARPRSLKATVPAEKLPIVQEPSTSQHPDDLQRATLLSKIQEIKDVLPDHGDGFLERCLLEFSMNTEQVIAHLLDGELPPNLSSLDPYMPLSDAEPRLAQPDAPSTSTAAGSSSNRQTFFRQFLFPDEIGPGWNATYNEKPPQTTDIKDWAEVRVGRSRRKVDRKTATVLDQSGSDIRQIVIRQANELLADAYDDDYDDSFDDLGVLGGADGQADVEGDDNHDTAAKSKKPYFVKDGKIYHAPKEGAVAVSDLKSAKTAASSNEEVIHGLGRGGNRPDGHAAAPVPTPGPAPRGRGRRGRGRGGNHHRKERSLKKQGP